MFFILPLLLDPAGLRASGGSPLLRRAHGNGREAARSLDGANEFPR